MPDTQEISARFEYAPFSDASGQIRLSSFVDGQAADQVQCVLSMHNIQDCPEYYAISYT